MIPKTWLFATAVVAVGAALAAIGGVAWRRQGSRCAMDGAILAPSASVNIENIETESGLALEFCSLACAEHYLNTSQLKPSRILLIDESTGQRIDAADAQFVRSQVASPLASGERRHVFAFSKDAIAHADAFRGRLLIGNDAPFASYRAWKHHLSGKTPKASGDAQKEAALPQRPTQ